MRLQKKILSYFNFIITAILLSVISVTLIAASINSLNIISFTFNNEVLDILFIPFVATLVLLFSFLIALLIRFFRCKIFKKYNENNILRRILHLILFLSILCLGIYFRYQNILANYYNDEIAVVVRKYFNGENAGITNSLSYVYICLVSFVSKFVGIKECVYLWVNIVFECLSYIFLFFSVKVLYGRIPALFSFAGTMLLAFSYFNVINSEGLTLLLFLTSLCIMLFSFLIKSRYNRFSDKNIYIIYFVFLGALSGYISYLNMYALLAVLYMFSLIFIFKPSMDEEMDEEEQIKKYGEVIYFADYDYDDNYEKDPIWIGNIWPAITYLVFAVMTFGAMLFVDSCVYNIPFENVLFTNKYFDAINFNVINSYMPSHYMLEFSFLLILACLGVFAFVFHSSDNLSGFIVLILAFVPFFVFASNPTDLYSVSFILIGSLVGNGIDFILFRKPRTPIGNEEHEKSLVMDDISTDGKAENDLTKETVQETETVKDTEATSSSDILSDLEEISIAKDKLTFENIALNEEINKAKEIKFIENVLPVPKKHVKKEMDYAFEPPVEKMSFDIEISADDDFDLE